MYTVCFHICILSVLTGIDAVSEGLLSGCEVIQRPIVGAACPVVFLQCSEIHPSSDCEVVTVIAAAALHSVLTPMIFKDMV